MVSLEQDIQYNKASIDDFIKITIRILQYLPNVLSGREEKNGYWLYFSYSANTKKFVRPINSSLFIMNVEEFESASGKFLQTLQKIKSNWKEFESEDLDRIDSVLYTIQQSIGAAFDLLVESNSARKHVGNRFEELIKALFTEIGIPNKRVVLKIPYDSEHGKKYYTCENDLILSPSKDLRKSDETAEVILDVKNNGESLEEESLILDSTSKDDVDEYINNDEVIVSVKTTSKDRMGKMFMDKILLERFVGHSLKFVGIFLNDVQRKGTKEVSYTLVSGLFMVYNRFITELDGVYYLDPPPVANKEPFTKHIKRFSTLITTDIDLLLSS